MARYTVDPATGIKTKVRGTNYVPPCVVKTAERKAKTEPPAPVIELTATEPKED